MNQVILMGRLTADPEVRHSQSGDSLCIARYTLAVDRAYRPRDGEASADFIRCTAIGKTGEFAEKYLHKGIKIAIVGRISTGSYTNNEGRKVYTTEVVVLQHEFCESKSASENAPRSDSETSGTSSQHTPDGFMELPDGLDDEELPWN